MALACAAGASATHTVLNVRMKSAARPLGHRKVAAGAPPTLPRAGPAVRSLPARSTHQSTVHTRARQVISAPLPHVITTSHAWVTLLPASASSTKHPAQPVGQTHPAGTARLMHAQNAATTAAASAIISCRRSSLRHLPPPSRLPAAPECGTGPPPQQCCWSGCCWTRPELLRLRSSELELRVGVHGPQELVEQRLVEHLLQRHLVALAPGFGRGRVGAWG